MQDEPPPTFLQGGAAELQGEVDAMLAAVYSDDPDAYAEHDIKFHRIILEASQNRVLRRVWDEIWLLEFPHARRDTQGLEGPI